MTDAPERIWADPDHWIEAPPASCGRKPGEYTEYIRADLVPAWSSDMDAAPKDGTRQLAEMLREVNASPTQSMIWEVNGRLYRAEVLPALPHLPLTWYKVSLRAGCHIWGLKAAASRRARALPTPTYHGVIRQAARSTGSSARSTNPRWRSKKSACNARRAV